MSLNRNSNFHSAGYSSWKIRSPFGTAIIAPAQMSIMVQFLARMAATANAIGVLRRIELPGD
jgi:hypothetical protein